MLGNLQLPLDPLATTVSARKYPLFVSKYSLTYLGTHLSPALK